MPYLPRLTETSQTRQVTEVFGGYNHNLKIGDGEWYTTENLTAAHYPMFAQRGARAVYLDGAADLKGIIAKDALAWVDGAQLYFDGYAVPGIELTEEGPKQLVSMGAYLCIFPDGAYVNTADLSDCGRMGAQYTSPEGCEIVYSPCDADGGLYDMDGVIASDAEPEDPANGEIWLDTSAQLHVMKVYSASSGMWVQIPTVYTKIEATGIGAMFQEGDGVSISGADYEGSYAELEAQVGALNTDCILQARGDDFIIVTGLIDQVCVQSASGITVERRVPKMDYVCEANNRLWGCFYGMHDGKMINEIYACKQGDFKNWYCYAGISTDSYAVSVGTDGEFTGCIAHMGYPLFFKENCIHKIYGSMPSEYSVQTTTCRGVQRGSGASLAVVNEVLYYKSRSDICAYDGSLPVGVSAQLGTGLYCDAVAGAHGGKYYVSMRGADGWELFIYDTQRGIWLREDATHATGFAAWGDELFYIDAERGAIIAHNGTAGTGEGTVEWAAESGLIGYELIDHKYVSRFNFRMKLGEGAKCLLAIEYDSSGSWEDQGAVYGPSTGAFIVPVIPRRCDHFRIRLSGCGEIRIFSMARILEQGSDLG